MKQRLFNLLQPVALKPFGVAKAINFKGLLRGLPVVAMLLLLAIAGCDTPEKTLKSTDINYKKAKAISWYNKKEYYKCIPVFEELIGLMKGRQNTEDLYYMYANANFQQGDYMISAYHFKNFYDLYPQSEKAEECLFMYAKSYERLSPKPDLDQSYTMKALDAYALFLNTYPNGKYVGDANTAIGNMRRKLEKKAMNAAELYYKTSNYKAAATCYVNILKNYPDIPEGEFVTLMIIKSNYEYAKNSIPSKKSERYERVIKSYADFKDKFGQSKYLAEAAGYEHESHYYAAISAYDWAEISPVDDRESNFLIYFREAKDNLPAIADKKRVEEINQRIEKGYFLCVKSNFQAAEERKKEQKVPFLLKTVKSYNTFVDKYPKSRFSKEAEKMFSTARDLLQKFNTTSTNGQS